MANDLTDANSRMTVVGQGLPGILEDLVVPENSELAQQFMHLSAECHVKQALFRAAR